MRAEVYILFKLPSISHSDQQGTVCTPAAVEPFPGGSPKARAYPLVSSQLSGAS